MVGLALNIATQPSLAGAWAELGNYVFSIMGSQVIPSLVYQGGLRRHTPLTRRVKAYLGLSRTESCYISILYFVEYLEYLRINWVIKTT